MHQREQNALDELFPQVFCFCHKQPENIGRVGGSRREGPAKKLIAWIGFCDEQLSSRLVRDDGTVIEACDRCREIYKKRMIPSEPPCETCRVDLMEENETAARIFQTVRGQVRTMWNGEQDIVFDLDHCAVWATIDAYRVSDRVGMFDKIRHCFFHFLNEERRNGTTEI